MKFFGDVVVKELRSSAVMKRCDENPVLEASDVPFKSDLVSNAGVTKFQGKYVIDRKSVV